MGLKDIVESNHREYGSEYKERKEKGFRIVSPSGIKKFLDNPYEWSINVLDGKPTFFGNNATALGSVVHKYIELYRSNKLTSDGKLPSIDRDAVLSTSTDLDLKDIYDSYPSMCEAVREHYLEVYPTDVLSEEYMEVELTDEKILIAGTIDELDLNNKVITDFKTCSKKPTEQDITKHIYQLGTYASLIKKTKDITIEKFRVVYIQKPTKTLGARVYICECDAIIDLSNDMLNQVIDTIRLIDSNPDMRNIIFRDNPLGGFIMPDKTNVEAFMNKYIKNLTFTTQEQSKVKQLQKNIFG